MGGLFKRSFHGDTDVEAQKIVNALHRKSWGNIAMYQRWKTKCDSRYYQYIP